MLVFRRVSTSQRYVMDPASSAAEGFAAHSGTSRIGRKNRLIASQSIGPGYGSSLQFAGSVPAGTCLSAEASFASKPHHFWTAPIVGARRADGAAQLQTRREMASLMPRAAMAVALLSATAASARTPPDLAAFVRGHVLTRSRIAQADLNGDGRPEALIYGMDTAGGGDADLCGTGGCNLYILSPTESGYRLMTKMTVTRPPVRVLPATTHGWHDLGVLVAGGGIESRQARLRFDGTGYPSIPPCLPPRA
jgi:hypothetical protein